MNLFTVKNHPLIYGRLNPEWTYIHGLSQDGDRIPDPLQTKTSVMVVRTRHWPVSLQWKNTFIFHWVEFWRFSIVTVSGRPTVDTMNIRTYKQENKLDLDFYIKGWPFLQYDYMNLWNSIYENTSDSRFEVAHRNKGILLRLVQGSGPDTDWEYRFVTSDDFSQW